VDVKNALTCESDIFVFDNCSSVRHGKSATFEFCGGDIPPNTEFFVVLNDDAQLHGNLGDKNGKGGLEKRSGYGDNTRTGHGTTAALAA